MIDKQFGGFQAVCDACGTVLDDGNYDFQDAVNEMKANGWKTVKVGDEWLNYCPVCAREIKCPGPGEFVNF